MAVEPSLPRVSECMTSERDVLVYVIVLMSRLGSHEQILEVRVGFRAKIRLSTLIHFMINVIVHFSRIYVLLSCCENKKQKSSFFIKVSAN